MLGEVKPETRAGDLHVERQARFEPVREARREAEKAAIELAALASSKMRSTGTASRKAGPSSTA